MDFLIVFGFDVSLWFVSSVQHVFGQSMHLAFALGGSGSRVKVTQKSSLEVKEAERLSPVLKVYGLGFKGRGVESSRQGELEVGSSKNLKGYYCTGAAASV